MDSLKQAGDPPVLYAKIGTQLFRSSDRGTSWTQQGIVPGIDPIMDISDSPGNRMYCLDRISLSVYNSGDSGHFWTQTGSPATPPVQNPANSGIGIAPTLDREIFVSVAGVGAFRSMDSGATFVDLTSVGLGEFSRILAGPSGPMFAVGAGPVGFYRSDDNGQSWRTIGATGADLKTLTAVDPTDHRTVYAVRSGATSALVRSNDGGDNWTPISASIKPTIAKPASGINVTVEERAPYSQAFTVQAFEDSSWAMAVTLSTSGETWLQLGTSSGTTPLADSVTITTSGLAPGTYQASIRIDAAQSFNQSVTVPVQLTIRPFGSLGPQYSTDTVAGNGNANDTRASGRGTDLGIGSAKALAVDASGRLLISAGNRIWQMSGSNATVLAGNGTFGSGADGGDATQTPIADPDAIAFDQQGTVYFTEYSSKRVRKILNSAINTSLDLARFNDPGSHALAIDSFGRLLVTNPSGVLRYDGAKLTPIKAYVFSDPYGMASDAAGNLYVSDRGSNQIVRIAPDGSVSTFAGTGVQGFAGDGGPAVQAMLNTPSGITVDAQGIVYFADTGNQRVRAIRPDGTIRTVAGSGVSGFAGDGVTADFTSFKTPAAGAVDQQGNLFVADSGNNRVRKLTLQNVTTPQPTAVVNAASGGLKLSPGSLFSVYGYSLGGSTPIQTSTTPWPRSLGATSGSINGVPAPLYYVSANLINGQIPYKSPTGTATAVVTVNGSAPPQFNFPVVAASPGGLVYNTNRAVAVNADGNLNGPDKPALAGDVELMFLTGIGTPDHPVATGAGAPSAEPLARVQYPYSITINGQSVQVFYLGLAPGYPALVQANFLVPNLPPGDYPLVVTVNGEASNTVMFAIGR